jgi:hypothetical protein
MMPEPSGESPEVLVTAPLVPVPLVPSCDAPEVLRLVPLVLVPLIPV